MTVYTYKRPGWMKLAQQKRVQLVQRHSTGRRKVVKGVKEVSRGGTTFAAFASFRSPSLDQELREGSIAQPSCSQSLL
jgi:hypothetical protein